MPGRGGGRGGWFWERWACCRCALEGSSDSSRCPSPQRGFVLVGEGMHRCRGRSSGPAVERHGVVDPADREAGLSEQLEFRRGVVPVGDSVHGGRMALDQGCEIGGVGRTLGRLPLAGAATSPPWIGPKRAERDIVHLGEGLHSSRRLRSPGQRYLSRGWNRSLPCRALERIDLVDSADPEDLGASWRVVRGAEAVHCGRVRCGRGSGRAPVGRPRVVVEQGAVWVGY